MFNFIKTISKEEREKRKKEKDRYEKVEELEMFCWRASNMSGETVIGKSQYYFEHKYGGYGCEYCPLKKECEKSPVSFFKIKRERYALSDEELDHVYNKLIELGETHSQAEYYKRNIYKYEEIKFDRYTYPPEEYNEIMKDVKSVKEWLDIKGLEKNDLNILGRICLRNYSVCKKNVFEEIMLKNREN